VGEARGDAVTVAFAALASYLVEGRWAASPRPAPPEAVAALDRLRRFGGVELELLARAVAGSRLRAAAAAAALLELFIAPPESSGDAAPQNIENEHESSTTAPSYRIAIERGFDALEGAAHLVDEVRRLSPWASWHTRGSALEDALVERLDDLATLVGRVPELQAIADRLGRIAASERAARGVERGGRQTVVGVTTGGELADVLPCELALLADPETEDLFYARLAERRLLSLELSGDGEGATVRARRPGPVIACVDTSGSMQGAPEALAKAAILAVARRVLGAGRRMTVLLFGGRGAVTELALSPSRIDLGALFALLMTSYYGGTDLDGPLGRALDLRERAPGMRDADLLLVTDGLCRLGPAVAARISAARARGNLEVVSVVVGGHVERVAPFSDVVWPLAEDAITATGLAGYR
jgi:uncharacterized protein with von Willebrand factor type A (vWA) domain